MDILGIDEIESFNTPVDDLTTEDVNLIFVGIDRSGSMTPHVQEMRTCIKDFKDAIANSKEADQILTARASFDSSIEIGGYKPINDFDESYSTSGSTKLYDVIVEGKEKLLTYMEHLRKQGVRVKAVFAVFSDGDDVGSHGSFADARRAVEELNQKEVVTAFICFNVAEATAKNLQFQNIMRVGGSASDLRKAFNVLSKSVIESSKSVLSKQDNFFTM
jgi:uncharacterized protein YegL